MSAKQVLLLPAKVLVLAAILTATLAAAGAGSGLGHLRPQPQAPKTAPQPEEPASPHRALDFSKMKFHPELGASPPEANAPTPETGKVLRLTFVACLLQTIVLAYIILRSPWRGWKQVCGVFTAFFGAGFLQAGLESAVYLRAKFPGLGPRILLMGAITATVFSPLAVLILARFGRGPETDAAPQPGIAGWKALAVVVAFLVIYYTCGYYIAWQSPYVREFYGGTDPGSFLKQLVSVWSTQPWMYPFQALRGLIYFFIALLVVRMLKSKPWEAGLAVALLFSVISSAQLIPPNPLMGEAVARVHLVELLVGNSIFGAFTGWLLSRGGRLQT